LAAPCAAVSVLRSASAAARSKYPLGGVMTLTKKLAL
jgi:hypothetical protein